MKNDVSGYYKDGKRLVDLAAEITGVDWDGALGLSRAP